MAVLAGFRFIVSGCQFKQIYAVAWLPPGDDYRRGVSHTPFRPVVRKCPLYSA